MRYHLNFRDLNGRTRVAGLFQREAAKLQRHLRDFKPDLVDIWGRLERLPRHAGYVAELRLNLPSGTLTAAGRGFSRAGAWHEVTKEMVARLARHKARLAGSRSRQRRQHETRRWAEHADTPEQIQTRLQASYGSLLDFLRSEIRRHEHQGTLPRKSADAEELAAEVAMEALRAAHAKPVDLTYEHWFFRLGYERLLDTVVQARAARRTRRRPPSLDTILPRREGPEGLVEEDDLVDELIGPRPRARYGDDIPDPRSVT